LMGLRSKSEPLIVEMDDFISNPIQPTYRQS
jgi:hypothetical protein